LDDAERMFQSALAIAVLSGDQFLQTQATMNLGVVALQEEHYEDALARFGEASTLAKSIGAKLQIEKAVGNIGFVYYKTGDFQRALTSFKEAEQQAAALDSPIDQVRSLNNAGLSEYRLGNLESARSPYEQSLGLAQTIQNQELILDPHVDLGFLLLRQGRPTAAAIHVNEANRVAALMRNDRAALEPMLLDALLQNAKGDKRGAPKRQLDLEEHSVNVPSLQWEAESNLARIYSESGRPIDADAWFRRSIDTFQRQRSSLTSVESTLPFLANGNDLYISTLTTWST
jgi:tetratricopeptide (TPR) repeat protein